eukprot:3450964-Amphidinium_carterae.2
MQTHTHTRETCTAQLYAHSLVAHATHILWLHAQQSPLLRPGHVVKLSTGLATAFPYFDNDFKMQTHTHTHARNMHCAALCTFFGCSRNTHSLGAPLVAHATHMLWLLTQQSRLSRPGHVVKLSTGLATALHLPTYSHSVEIYFYIYCAALCTFFGCARNNVPSLDLDMSLNCPLD